MPTAVALTDAQIDLMRVLWARGEATIADVHQALARTRPVAPTTVATVLARLEKKRAVTHRVDGRQFVYRALVSEADVRRTALGTLAAQLFTGSVPALVSQLLADRDVTPAELDEVKALIGAKERELQAHSGGRGGRRSDHQ